MSLVHGVLVAHAGLCLLELLPKKPWKMSVDILFVLGQCANAMCFGLLATGLNAKAHGLSLLAGTDSSKVYSVEILTYICTAMISFFVMVTKSHWNWKENTGREFPKDPEPLTNEVQQAFYVLVLLTLTLILTRIPILILTLVLHFNSTVPGEQR